MTMKMNRRKKRTAGRSFTRMSFVFHLIENYFARFLVLVLNSCRSSQEFFSLLFVACSLSIDTDRWSLRESFFTRSLRALLATSVEDSIDNYKANIGHGISFSRRISSPFLSFSFGSLSIRLLGHTEQHKHCPTPPFSSSPSCGYSVRDSIPFTILLYRQSTLLSFSRISIDSLGRYLWQELDVEFRCSLSNEEYFSRDSSSRLVSIELGSHADRRLLTIFRHQRWTLLYFLDVLGKRSLHALRHSHNCLSHSSLGHGLYFHRLDLLSIGCWRLSMVVAIDRHIRVRFCSSSLVSTRLISVGII